MRSECPLRGVLPNHFRSLLFLIALSLVVCIAPAMAQDAPLLKVLNQFTAADVPALGPG